MSGMSSSADGSGHKAEADRVAGLFAAVIQTKREAGAIRTYSEELSSIRNAMVNPGLYCGVSAGLVQFAVLRKAPAYWLRTKGVDPSTMSMHTTPVGRTMGLLFDVTLSAMLGASVWMYTADREKIYAAAGELPLMGGRSGISDSLCRDFMSLNGTVPGKIWKGEEARNRADLRAIQAFVLNCRRREAFVDRLKREGRLTMAEGGLVIIPEGGVPNDFILQEQEEMEQEEMEQEEMGGGYAAGWESGVDRFDRDDEKEGWRKE